MRRPQFQIKGRIRNPSGMFKNPTIQLHKPIAIHLRWTFIMHGRMGRGPVMRNINAACKPHIRMGFCIFHKPTQGRHATGTTDQTAMQPDGHHFGRSRLPLGIKRIKRILEVIEKLVARVEPLRRGKAHIIGIQRIGYDQLIAPLNRHPIGQIIIIGVGNIIKPALLRDQGDRVDRTAPRIPSARTFACHLCV